jgi:Ca2+-binding RTX toxin-like protein
MANIEGTAGPDILIGTDDDDRLDGREGNDLIIGGLGDDVLIGGAGVDMVSYAGAGSGVKIDLTLTTAQTTATDGKDILSGFENLRGSGFGDTLIGDAGTNMIVGDAGNDIIDGGDGNDTILGGAGSDRLTGGLGIDTLSYAGDLGGVTVSLAIATLQHSGGSGNDTVAGFENLTGSAFDDRLVGDASANIIAGGAGDDVLDGGAGNDLLDGGAGFDVVSYAGSASTVNVSLAIMTAQNLAASGRDTLASIEGLIGTIFGDRLVGDDGDNILTGGGGNDQLTGAAGNDILRGGAGSDILRGGDGVDLVTYDDATSRVVVNLMIDGTVQHTRGSGNDSMTAIENLTGSRYNDVLQGSTGANIIHGGAGDDRIDGGTGADQLFGDAGIDTVGYGSTIGGVTVDLNISIAQNTGGGGIDTLSGFENLSGSRYNDRLIGDGGVNIIRAGAGSDIVAGGAGNDQLFGEGGVDYLDGGAGQDMLNGGTRGDLFIVSAATDSAVGFGDIIADFHHAEKDRIDLSGLYGGTLSFIGTGAFSHHAGELRYALSGSDLFVSGDIDGDAIADFEIKLVGVQEIVATDFML